MYVIFNRVKIDIVFLDMKGDGVHESGRISGTAGGAGALVGGIGGGGGGCSFSEELSLPIRKAGILDALPFISICSRVSRSMDRSPSDFCSPSSTSTPSTTPLPPAPTPPSGKLPTVSDTDGIAEALLDAEFEVAALFEPLLTVGGGCGGLLAGKWW